MHESLNTYQMVLEIAEIAEDMDYKRRNEVDQEKNEIKKIINKPKQTRKIPYEAYLYYFNKKQPE